MTRIELAGSFAHPPRPWGRIQIAESDWSGLVCLRNEVAQPHDGLPRDGSKPHCVDVKGRRGRQVFRVVNGTLTGPPGECRQSQVNEVHVGCGCVGDKEHWDSTADDNCGRYQHRCHEVVLGP